MFHSFMAWRPKWVHILVFLDWMERYLLQSIGGLGGVFQNAGGFLSAFVLVNVLDVVEGDPDDLPSHPHNILQNPPVTLQLLYQEVMQLVIGVRRQDSYPLQPPEEVNPLLCPLSQKSGTQCPGEILSDAETKEYLHC